METATGSAIAGGQPRGTSLPLRAAVILLLAVPALIFVNARGCVEMFVWDRWAQKIMQFGPIEGYRQIWMDYPPLASQFLGLAAWCGSVSGVTTMVSIKILLLIAWWLTVGVFWVATRSYWATVLAGVSLLLHGAAHGHLDVCCAPLLIGALAAFTGRRYTTFAVLYACSMMVEWLPVIMAPFFFMHVIRGHSGPSFSSAGLKFFTRRVAAPMVGVALVFVGVFGRRALGHALGLSMGGPLNQYWSVMALNLPWAVAYCIELIQPHDFTGYHGAVVSMNGGAGEILALPSGGVRLLTHLPFAAAYLFCLYSVWKSPVSATRTLTGCLMGCLTFFMLSTGVHESHLFPAVLLALYVFATKGLPLEVAVTVSLMMNTNLLVFHGLDGRGLRVDGVLGGTVDVAFLMAVTNVIVYFFMFRAFIRQQAEERCASLAKGGPAERLSSWEWPFFPGRILIIMLMAVPALILVNAQGRPDIGFFWEPWADKILKDGPAEGYRQIWTDYPPLASQCLGLAAWLGAKLGMGTVVSIKASLLVAFGVTLGVFWRISRHYWATFLCCVSLVLHGPAHAYLDIYYAPLLIGAFAAFIRRRYGIFSVLYTLSLLVKWQPVIIAPFFFLHIVRELAQSSCRLDELIFLVRRVAAPVIAIGLVILLVFGGPSLMHALSLTFGGPLHQYWSVMALNLPWTVAYVFELLQPHNFAGYHGAIVSMKGDAGEILALPSGGIQLLTRLPFAAAYLFCLYSVWRSPVSATRTLTGCLMGYLTYFMLSTGVHENHLFPAVLLALYLFATGHLSLEATICLALIMNENILLFNGLDGANLRMDRVLGGKIDMAFLMAVSNVAVLSLIWVVLWRWLRSGDHAKSPCDAADQTRERKGRTGQHP